MKSNNDVMGGWHSKIASSFCIWLLQYSVVSNEQNWHRALISISYYLYFDEFTSKLYSIDIVTKSDLFWPIDLLSNCICFQILFFGESNSDILYSDCRDCSIGGVRNWSNGECCTILWQFFRRIFKFRLGKCCWVDIYRCCIEKRLN